MPLIKCPDCGREVSEKAKACPGCGRPVKAQNGRKTAFLNTIAFLILAISAFIAKDEININSFGLVEICIALGISGIVLVWYYVVKR